MCQISCQSDEWCRKYRGGVRLISPRLCIHLSKCILCIELSYNIWFCGVSRQSLDCCLWHSATCEHYGSRQNDFITPIWIADKFHLEAMYFNLITALYTYFETVLCCMHNQGLYRGKFSANWQKHFQNKSSNWLLSTNNLEKFANLCSPWSHRLRAWSISTCIVAIFGRICMNC